RSGDLVGLEHVAVRPADEPDPEAPSADRVAPYEVVLRSVDRDAGATVVADDVVEHAVEARGPVAVLPVVEHDPVPTVADRGVVRDQVVVAQPREDDPVAAVGG